MVMPRSRIFWIRSVSMLALARIHPRDRLVEEQKLRPGGQGHSHTQSPLEAVRQASGLSFWKMLEAHELERLGRLHPQRLLLTTRTRRPEYPLPLRGAIRLVATDKDVV